MTKVVVLDYGSGNLRSAQRALERTGADVTVTADRSAALAADGLVVPGVGAFEACMAQASCEEAAIAVCEERLDAALGACVTSPSVSLALEQCLVASGESFVCANGEVVAESWICDGWDDCSDGSDEVGC